MFSKIRSSLFLCNLNQAISPEKVWYRFEGKRKDGNVLKLRIQDLPPARMNDAVDLMVNYFIKGEPVNKAVGMANNPLAVEVRRKFYKLSFSDPLCRALICCSDNSDDVKDIMGLSAITYSTDVTSWIEKIKSVENATQMTKEEKKYYDIVFEYFMAYNPVKEFNLDKYYVDKGMAVASHYKGLGIAEKFLKVRRIICEADGVSMTGAWMTAIGTQIAAARDGWETVYEIEYDYLAKKYDVPFTDVPPTMKFMIAKINTSEAKNTYG